MTQAKMPSRRENEPLELFEIRVLHFIVRTLLPFDKFERENILNFVGNHYFRVAAKRLAGTRC